MWQYILLLLHRISKMLRMESEPAKANTFPSLSFGKATPPISANRLNRF